MSSALRLCLVRHRGELQQAIHTDGSRSGLGRPTYLGAYKGETWTDRLRSLLVQTKLITSSYRCGQR